MNENQKTNTEPKKGNKKAKAILAIFVAVVVLVTGYLVFMKVTEHDRFVKREMKEVVEELDKCRSKDSSFALAHTWRSELLNDQKFIDFLTEQASGLMKNGDLRVLESFLYNLEFNNIKLDGISEVLKNEFDNAESIDAAYRIVDGLSILDYYNSVLILNRSSKVVAAYIEEHGTEQIYTEPGTGYDADEEDSSSFDRVGLDTSPLYDSESVIYAGDFKYDHSSGVKLDSNYNETYYSSTRIYFRNNYVQFSPDDGECVYSGNYLFCFAKNGDLIDFARINNK